ncbi:MAG: Jag N-terminal domain-containing protein [Campylobacterales bacterium]
MIRVEAATLEEAYTLASQKLHVSVTELDFEIIQQPTRGFFGLGKRRAIVVAAYNERYHAARRKESSQEKQNDNSTSQQPSTSEIIAANQTTVTPPAPSSQLEAQDMTQKTAPIQEFAEERLEILKKIEEPIENFYREKRSLEEIAEEVGDEVSRLFAHLCFELDPPNVTIYDPNTLMIKFSGPDSALLIAKQGYRYKALSYMLFSWIHAKYGVDVRVEVAEFLQTQEEKMARMIDALEPSIMAGERVQTPPLDGVLFYIAMRQLKTRFPNVAVAIKNGYEGVRSIIINARNER